VREAGELAGLGGDGDGHHFMVPELAGPAQIEALVDGLLELDGLAPPLHIDFGQLREPLRPHAHMGDLVGEDEVQRALQYGIADLIADVDELVEDVARETLETPVDAGHAGGGVFRAGATPEDGRLGKLADIAVQVLEQTDVDLDVAGLVPDLPRHVQAELPWRVGEVVHRAAGPLHGLHLSHHDAVGPLLDGVAAGEPGKRRQALADLALRDLPRAHAHHAVFPGELVERDLTLHRCLLDDLPSRLNDCSVSLAEAEPEGNWDASTRLLGGLPRSGPAPTRDEARGTGG